MRSWARGCAPQVGSRSVVDLAMSEEACAAATLHVAVSPAGRVAGLTKQGSRGMNPSAILVAMETAQRTGVALVRQLDGYVPAALAAMQ